MKNRKLIENSYSPVRVRTVLGSRGRMLYHAADVCDVLGLATEALEQVEPIEIKANGELIAVLDMQAVNKLAGRSPLPYARDVLDWMQDLASEPLSKALDGMESKIMQIIEQAGEAGVTRNAITRKTQAIDARARNRLLADMVERELVRATFCPDREILIFKAVKYAA